MTQCVINLFPPFLTMTKLLKNLSQPGNAPLLMEN